MVSIAVSTPAESGLPLRPQVLALHRDTAIPTTGIPIILLRGPFPTRAALGIDADVLVIQPLSPLLPSNRFQRGEITLIEMESRQWYVFGRKAIRVHREKGLSFRLLSPSVPGLEDGTETLLHLLLAWWKAGA